MYIILPEFWIFIVNIANILFKTGFTPQFHFSENVIM